MEQVRVAVIGGGVIGASVLYHLARAGWADCLLLEKATLTSGSTWHAAANGNTFNGSTLIAWSMKRTFELWAEIEVESGQSVSAHRVGGVMVPMRTRLVSVSIQPPVRSGNRCVTRAATSASRASSSVCERSTSWVRTSTPGGVGARG